MAGIVTRDAVAVELRRNIMFICLGEAFLLPIVLVLVVLGWFRWWVGVPLGGVSAVPVIRLGRRWGWWQ